MEKTAYHSFLLRLWFVKQDGQMSWRASVEDPKTREQQFFLCFEELIIFLRQLNEDMESREDIGKTRW